jgi:hypothetical protein
MFLGDTLVAVLNMLAVFGSPATPGNRYAEFDRRSR